MYEIIMNTVVVRFTFSPNLSGCIKDVCLQRNRYIRYQTNVSIIDYDQTKPF